MENRDWKRAADRIRESGGYRWVGIYEVGAEEIAILAWSGEGSPAYPRFPKERGLCGAAVAARSTIVSNDVANDSRYLTTFGSTRSEVVVPIRGQTGDVVGLIDVESDRIGAFTPEDVRALEASAADLAPLRP
jgi:L-methionine (R)-S-oxide reductase